jgi:hypothetical protein
MLADATSQLSEISMVVLAIGEMSFLALIFVVMTKR